MKCYEIRFDNGNVMFVRDSALAKNIEHAFRLAAGHCQVNTADIGDEIIAPISPRYAEGCAEAAPPDRVKAEQKNWR